VSEPQGPGAGAGEARPAAPTGARIRSRKPYMPCSRAARHDSEPTRSRRVFHEAGLYRVSENENESRGSAAGSHVRHVTGRGQPTETRREGSCHLSATHHILVGHGLPVADGCGWPCAAVCTRRRPAAPSRRLRELPSRSQRPVRPNEGTRRMRPAPRKLPMRTAPHHDVAPSRPARWSYET
jgi:hypothetical protein